VIIANNLSTHGDQTGRFEVCEANTTLKKLAWSLFSDPPTTGKPRTVFFPMTRFGLDLQNDLGGNG
jgi:hypothetical protein